MLIKLKEKLLVRDGFAGRALSLRQNFAWTLIGDMIFAATQWGMLAAIAKLGTPETVGIFTFGLAVTAPIIIFANLKLRAVQATDANKEYQFGDYLALRLGALALACTGIFLFIGLSDYAIETKLVVAFVTVAKSFDSLSDIIYGYFQLHEQMNRIAFSRIVQGLGQLFVLAFVLLTSHSLVWSIGAWAIASGFVTLFVDVPNLRHLHNQIHSHNQTVDGLPSLAPRWEVSTQKKMFLLALPLGLATMLGSLGTNIPRYVIQYYQGAYSLGIFAAVVSLAMIGNTVVSALGQSASPRLAKYHANHNYNQFDKLISQLVCMALVLGLVGLFVVRISGEFVLSLLYTTEYAIYSELLTWLFLGLCFQYTFIFLGTGLQAMREFRFFFPIQIINNISILLATIYFIPIYGLRGGVFAIVLSNLVESFLYLITFFYTRHHVRNHLNTAI